MLNIYLSVLGITGNVVAVDGKRTAAIPAFAWGIKSATTIHLYASGGNTALIADLSAYSWILAMAKDWNPSTPPAYRIDSTGITVVDNALVIDVLPNTAEMLTVLGVSPVANIKAELIGYQGGVAVRTIQFPVSVGNRVDGTGVPEELVPNHYDKQVIDAKFAAIGDAIPAATESSRGTIALATAEEAAAGVEAGKAVTPATLRPLVDAKEAVANKTQEIDAVTPSADKYTSEAAVVAHVAGLIPHVPEDISELTDTTGILAGKVDKVTGYGLSKNDYTDADAAKVGKIEIETLAELTGADVSVAPWTQSKWSASGACSLTASGWAASGHQVAYIVITLAAEATPSIIGTEEVADDDALSAAGVYECYIKNVDGKKYFRVISFAEAA